MFSKTYKFTLEMTVVFTVTSQQQVYAKYTQYAEFNKEEPFIPTNVKRTILREVALEVNKKHGTNFTHSDAFIVNVLWTQD